MTAAAAELHAEETAAVAAAALKVEAWRKSVSSVSVHRKEEITRGVASRGQVMKGGFHPRSQNIAAGIPAQHLGAQIFEDRAANGGFSERG
eukprot:CAMPEP_0173065128 /NCGR_PEP_ID=MMETSP1102-20130122/5420_1 /TAXON_ID=49646 /ORGANISM="Geminigera sp., Strain Caron Lab Isolate" /LENGTH=90 /DNA_ID=CAMNT_0013932313 /DNA_START=1362 /DNA_END=1630 /DNA_ORIENTATION=+